MKFRIKIEELGNGNIEYTPQVKDGIFSCWKNILIDWHFVGHFTTATDACMIYNDISITKDIINRYIAHLESESGKKIKRTKYDYLVL